MAAIDNPYLGSLLRWPIPIVPVPPNINPLHHKDVHISIADASQLPGGSVKFLTVCGLVRGAHKKGLLREVHTLVEATSGNTGVEIARHAAIRGLRTKLIVSSGLPAGKRDPLDLMGATLIDPNGRDPVELAREIGREPGHLNLDQYANMDGVEIHETVTGPQIFSGFGERDLSLPNVIAVAIGTGGTLIGLSKILRRLQENATSIGILLEKGQEVPGLRDLDRMRSIKLPWKGWADRLVEVGAKVSYRTSVVVNRATGMMTGPSLGSAYFGALRRLKQCEEHGNLDSLRKKNGRIDMVVFCADSFRPYGDRYKANINFTDLDSFNPEALFSLL